MASKSRRLVFVAAFFLTSSDKAKICLNVLFDVSVLHGPCLLKQAPAKSWLAESFVDHEEALGSPVPSENVILW